MKFIGKPDYSHASTEKVGILITNLGTPEAATPQALKKYLAEFLWDPRIVEYPRVLWWLILHMIILRIRPKRSAETYATIWMEGGSPLMVHTQAQVEAIKKKLAGHNLEHVEVDFAMRYGEPSIESVLLKMYEKNVTKLLVMPLYPQYSGSTTGSTFDAIAQTFSKLRWVPELRFIQHYADDEAYISACANQIQSYWEQHSKSQKLLLSFHGLPKRFLMAGDPYHCQCHKTARLIAEKLNLAEDQWQLTFQSRFGREEWLQPYTDKTLESLPKQGVKSIDVFCPGFSADCVETMEEIDILNREIYMEAGGEAFQYIPALNDSSDHIDALTQLAIRNLHSWPQTSEQYSTHADSEERQETQRRAKAIGAKN